MESVPEHLATKLEQLPGKPGVYIFLDSDGKPLYIGKARSLRQRVRSYFGVGDGRFFVHRLQNEVSDIQIIVVANEKEAALLENALIKEKKPKYNFKLRDDKEFLSIRLDLNEKWPRLTVVRRPKEDEARYFGPYESATAARKALRLVNRYFQLRTCRDAEFARRTRPCLEYQIRRCLGPCVLPVDREQYLAQAQMVALFLEGRRDDLLADLERRMREAAAREEFESAAMYRDQMRAIERVMVAQRVVMTDPIDADAVEIFAEEGEAEIALLRVRKGRIRDVRTYPAFLPLTEDELIASFLSAYYAQSEGLSDPPHFIFVPVEIEAMEGLSAILSERFGHSLHIECPTRNDAKDLLELARENARHAFRDRQAERASAERRLSELAKRLRLSRIPWRIECVDVSHLGGGDAMAALVAMSDGHLDRSRYRSFRIRSEARGDDLLAMHEVLLRRFMRAAEPKWELPELLIVDGGRSQLEVALQARDEAIRKHSMAGREEIARALSNLLLAALAKERIPEKKGGLPERIYLPGRKNPILIRL
ncbi:MAG: excinuclease ABC subunit UvrC, partial [Sandaracinaceae bacterium]|nr:excinuclease ABC subunit UvrC [Sandaracinaceae bacterium]